VGQSVEDTEGTDCLESAKRKLAGSLTVLVPFLACHRRR